MKTSSTRPRADWRADRVSDAADRDSIARIAAGDRAAFKLFYEKYYDQVLRFICRITGQMDHAQDGVNDVMLVVWQNSEKFRGESKVATWVMGIAYRKALQLARQQQRWLDRFKSSNNLDWNELPSAGPELTDEIELSEWLELGLRQLSPKQRVVVELTHFYGFSYKEIAKITDCPVNTVKTRMFHAREKLRRVLPPLGEIDSDQ